MTAPDAYRLSRYLKAKKSIDGRALNRRVWSRFIEELDGASSLHILEVGAGVGATVERIVNALDVHTEQTLRYTLVDRNPAVLETASSELRTWAEQHGFEVSGRSPQVWSADGESVVLELVTADLFDFAEAHDGDRFDAIVGQALFDLLRITDAIQTLRPLLHEGGLWYLPIHFDGVTAFEPPHDSGLDRRVETLYHESMTTDQDDGRAGDQSGRRLLTHLQDAGASLLEVGGSDWIIWPQDGEYPADEAYFLHHILHFIENELRGHPALDDDAFANWLSDRRRQVEDGQLTYIAHQLDVLARKG
ncbi:class I SAM-dependent methyltransferase [Salinibacter grassmerensis]|uniref:class I SAM-dependent methyltransferase n=1 Tax=Salinibacter grassmerensis TaxID=3040353 RepID=UPI0021E76C8A|nr:class I SAM-dependent methyltransferase [Salinibacter grassmerensis]